MQKYYLKINYWRLLSIVLLLGVIFFVLLLLIVAYEESDQGYEIVYNVAGSLFYIIAFPLALFAKIDSMQSGETFIWGAAAGIISWSVLIEVLLTRFGKMADK